MTKEKLTLELLQEFLNPTDVQGKTILDIIDNFFDSNVCIPKGENRHPYADVLHEWIEDITKDLEFLDPYRKTWEQSVLDTDANWECRIKPSEPVYEWQYLITTMFGTKDNKLSQYFTDDEVIHMVRSRSEGWTKIQETKRVRQ